MARGATVLGSVPRYRRQLGGEEEDAKGVTQRRSGGSGEEGGMEGEKEEEEDEKRRGWWRRTRRTRGGEGSGRGRRFWGVHDVCVLIMYGCRLTHIP